MTTGLRLLATLLILLTLPVAPAWAASPPGAPLKIDQSAVKGLFVKAPMPDPGTRQWDVLIQDMVDDPSISGADITVSWSDIDRGPGASPQYNWSVITRNAQPWIQAGKKVNLIVWGAAEGSGSGSTPNYVMAQVDKVQVPGGLAEPVFWEPGYIGNYEKFMRVLVDKFGNEPWMGYIRFGIGVGGENYPADNWYDPPQRQEWETYGLSEQKWIDFSLQVIDFEASLHSQAQLMVGINQYGPNYDLPQAVAAEAAKQGLGFGVQGYTKDAIQARQENKGAYADWLGLFARYAGKVPLEVQTWARSSPDGSGPVGSLTQALPFLIKQNVQIVELYPEELHIANDPSYPGYAQYHEAYQQAMAQAALALGVTPEAVSTAYTRPAGESAQQIRAAEIYGEKQEILFAVEGANHDLLVRSLQNLGMLYQEAGLDGALFAGGREVPVSPVVHQGRTMVTPDILAGVLGIGAGDIVWNKGMVSITSGLTKITLPVDSRTVAVNGQARTIDVPATLSGGRILLPLRFVSEAFGRHVTWYPGGRLIDIE